MALFLANSVRGSSRLAVYSPHPAWSAISVCVKHTAALRDRRDRNYRGRARRPCRSYRNPPVRPQVPPPRLCQANHPSPARHGALRRVACLKSRISCPRGSSPTAVSIDFPDLSPSRAAASIAPPQPGRPPQLCSFYRRHNCSARLKYAPLLPASHQIPLASPQNRCILCLGPHRLPPFTHLSSQSLAVSSQETPNEQRRHRGQSVGHQCSLRFR